MSRFLTDIMSKKTPEKPKLEVVPKAEPTSLPTEVKPEIQNSNSEQLPTQSNPNRPTQTDLPKAGSLKPPKATHPNRPTQSYPTQEHPVSPAKDFTKVPNSIVRTAIPEGIFKGLSRDTYDVIFQKSRGAINPTRFLEISKTELMILTGFSDNTIDAHLAYLRSVGLIVSQPRRNGKKSIIEVKVLDELSDLPKATYPNRPTQGYPTHPNLLDTNPTQELGLVGQGDTTENKELTDNSKTFFKDNKNSDDEAFAGMIAKLNEACEKLTGKKTSGKDREKWQMLAELLILELEVAAARAGGVSSVPAFLTEVLRRQFFAARQQQKSVAKTSKAKPDTIGKSESENFEIKPLDAQGRELALEELKEFAGESFLDDFKKWYTDEDWQWLTEKLAESGSKEQ